MNGYEQFRDFMIAYADFFDSVADGEQEKLDSLMSYELKKIEHTIAAQQAVSMKFSNLEQKRLLLQDAAGFGGMTFRQILESCEGARREELQILFDRIEQAVSEIKELNKESMRFVKSNLQTINTFIPQGSGVGYSEESTRRGSEITVFETTI